MNIQIPAKINLGLNIVSKRLDGYHNLETVFYPVPIYDELEIRKSNKLVLNMEGRNIDCNAEDNLVIKAYRLLEPIISQRHGQSYLSFNLKKSIPTQAGMGGGSADAAYTLLLLDKFFELNLTQQELFDYALRLGADCPFFILSRPAYATGVGEKLEEISLNLNDYYLGIIKPEVSVSTREAFSHISPRQPKLCCKEIVKLPIEMWKDKLKNDFEESVFALYPQLLDIKQSMYDAGALYASMTGSGSVVFGIFKEKNVDNYSFKFDYFVPLSAQRKNL